MLIGKMTVIIPKSSILEILGIQSSIFFPMGHVRLVFSFGGCTIIRNFTILGSPDDFLLVILNISEYSPTSFIFGFSLNSPSV